MLQGCNGPKVWTMLVLVLFMSNAVRDALTVITCDRPSAVQLNTPIQCPSWDVAVQNTGVSASGFISNTPCSNGKIWGYWYDRHINEIGHAELISFYGMCMVQGTSFKVKYTIEYDGSGGLTSDDSSVPTEIVSVGPTPNNNEAFSLLNPYSNSQESTQASFGLFQKINKGYIGYKITFNLFEGTRRILIIKLINVDLIEEPVLDFWNQLPNDAQSEIYYCPVSYKIAGFSYIKVDAASPKYRIIALSAQCRMLECSDPIGLDSAIRCGCPKQGTYSDANTQTCVPCPTGTYASSTMYATSCTACTKYAVSPPINNNYGVTYDPTSTPLFSPDMCVGSCNAGYGINQGGKGSLACWPCDMGKYKSSAGLFDCTMCLVGYYSGSLGALSCTSCPSGKYSNAQGSATCTDCTVPYASPGNYPKACSSTQDTSYAQCTACNAGFILDPACGTTSYTPPTCVGCAIGKYNPLQTAKGYTDTARVCIVCTKGTMATAIGSDSCSTCSNQRPTNGVYSEWTTVASGFCPTECNAGFGWTNIAQQSNGVYSGSCTACAKGRYSPGGATRPACTSCTPALTNNGYWLEPSNFNKSWNGCPWDCNTGFQADYTTGNCVPCSNGYYKSSGMLRTYDSQDKTIGLCKQCTTCNQFNTYESSACTTKSDRVCSACITQCNTSFYLTSCSLLSKSTCAACKSRCSVGQYLIGSCPGNVIFLV